MKPRKTFLLRIEPGLYAELEAWAQQQLRSVNGQIEFLLTQAVSKRKNVPAKTPTADHRSDSDDRGQA
jgi:hypothetical protein